MKPDEHPPSSAPYIGVAIACAGNILISLALTLQKLAHKRYTPTSRPPGTPLSRRKSTSPSPTPHPAHPFAPVTPLASPLAHRSRSDPLPFEAYEPYEPLQPFEVELADPLSDDEPSSPGAMDAEGEYLRSKLWWAGLGLMGLGETGNFLSYGFAPASVVAPLGTVALIANCFFAPLILRESFTRRNVLGMTLAIVGAVTVVWAATDSKPRMSPNELLAAVLAPSFLIYTGLNIALLVPLTLLSPTQYGARWIGIDVGTCALYGGYTVMATKALSSLLSSVYLRAFAYPIAWVAVFVLVVTSILQIKYLNRALMRFESKEVIPTQFVFFSMSAIIGSAVLYQEFRGLSISNFVNFAFGIATTFLGVYFLTNPVDPLSSGPDSQALSTPTLAPVDEETPLLFDPAASSIARRSSLRPPIPVASQPGAIAHKSSVGSLGRLPQSQGGLLLISSTPSTPVALPRSGRGRSDSSTSSPVLSPVSSRRI